ncbi:MAG: gliding motility lipoprotein GldB [Bacteroidales bacterium]
MINQRLIAGVFVWLSVVLVVACTRPAGRLNIDISEVPEVHLDYSDYATALFSLDTTRIVDELKKIQPEFGVFLNREITGRADVLPVVNFLSDTSIRSAWKAYNEGFPPQKELVTEIEDVFRHVRYYFPEAPLPHVYFYISGFDYLNRIVLTDEYLLVAVDLYLGPEFSQYRYLGLPVYMIDRFNDLYLIRDVAYEVASQLAGAETAKSNLLRSAIEMGKRLWLCRAFYPEMDLGRLLYYTDEQVEWAMKNEGLVWAFLIENDLLYSTSMLDIRKFTGEGPFTSWFGKESPPRLGWFIGYRMIEKLMEENPSITVDELLSLDAASVLRLSGYKPKLIR